MASLLRAFAKFGSSAKTAVKKVDVPAAKTISKKSAAKVAGGVVGVGGLLGLGIGGGEAVGEAAGNVVTSVTSSPWLPVIIGCVVLFVLWRVIS